MSMYSLLFGVSPATFLILPMLGKHPDKYPRFRDCFVHDDEHPEFDGFIHVYTRTGGGNRVAYADQNAEMINSKYYHTNFDDSFDTTYATWIFTVPDEWKSDYEKISTGTLSEVSSEYLEQIKRVFPKLADEIDKTFVLAVLKAREQSK